MKIDINLKTISTAIGIIITVLLFVWGIATGYFDHDTRITVNESQIEAMKEEKKAELEREKLYLEMNRLNKPSVPN